MQTIYRYPVIIEKGETSYGAYLPDLDGCIAVGDTPEDVLALIHGSLQIHLKSMLRDGDPIPAPSPIETIEFVQGLETVAIVEVEICYPVAEALYQQKSLSTLQKEGVSKMNKTRELNRTAVQTDIEPQKATSRRPTGRPALTSQQRTQKEATIDTHLNLPVSIVEKIDRLRSSAESRKDCVVRILREYPE